MFVCDLSRFRRGRIFPLSCRVRSVLLFFVLLPTSNFRQQRIISLKWDDSRFHLLSPSDSTCLEGILEI